MIAHTASGLALGALLAEAGLVAVIVGALLLHLLLDLVPHWDYIRSRHGYAAGALDVACSAAALLAARYLLGAEWIVVIAGLVSAIPDLDIFMDLVSPRRRIRFFPSHWRGFPHGSAPPLAGIATQAVVIALSTALLVLAL